jgi:hypothetical protein
MLIQKLTSLAISLVSSIALADASLPSWITNGKTSDQTFYYVNCSHDSLEPELATQMAEDQCLVSAAKLGGVTVTVHEKTVESLTGADSNQTSEMQPITKKVRCEFTQRYLQPIGTSFRVWLQCRVNKASVNSVEASSAMLPTDQPTKKLEHMRASLTVVSSPPADVIVIKGAGGERAINGNGSATQLIELHEGDSGITVKKQGYKDAYQRFRVWKNGSLLNTTFLFQNEK